MANSSDPIALVLIATGKYIEFLPKWFMSVRKNFLPDRKLKVVVFSDHTDLENLLVPERDSRVDAVGVYQPHAQWPAITLIRFHIMLYNLRHFDGVSHIFYLDADMSVDGIVGDEIIGDGLTAVLHPYFWDASPMTFPYERRSRSKAYIPMGEGSHYYMGAFQGGEINSFVDAMKSMAALIDTDLDDGISAVWQDESYWNRFLKDNPPKIQLGIDYCLPEGWDSPNRKITAIEKDHAYFRS